MPSLRVTRMKNLSLSFKKLCAQGSNTDLQITENERLLIPAGHMNLTEANLAGDCNVLLTLGSRKVLGMHGAGTGFLVKGTAKFLSSGPEFDAIKANFVWARAALVVTIMSVTQTL